MKTFSEKLFENLFEKLPVKEFLEGMLPGRMLGLSGEASVKYYLEIIL